MPFFPYQMNSTWARLETVERGGHGETTYLVRERNNMLPDQDHEANEAHVLRRTASATRYPHAPQASYAQLLRACKNET